MLFSPHYQGNMWWIGSAIFSLFLISQILWGAWRRHKVGIPVHVAAVAGLSLWILLFFAMAIFQVLTHDK
jgi:hypothetical protein